MFKNLLSLLLLSFVSASAFASSPTPVDQNPLTFFHHWQLGIGPGFVAAVNAPDLTTSWRVGFGVPLNEQFDISLITDFAISSQRTDMHYFAIKAASDYNFSSEDTTPFVTADFGYASVHAHADCRDASCESPGDDAGSVSLGVGGGYKFLRRRLVQVGVLGRYDVMFASTRYGTPMKYSIQAMLYF